MYAYIKALSNDFITEFTDLKTALKKKQNKTKQNKKKQKTKKKNSSLSSNLCGITGVVWNP